ncbi:ABC transporter permease [Pseudonocardia cypriaca]|uniref:NitT/TauT family transport system permease protein n=1 Tax=Pseudonocardia cypriaca TaxID=882449 RepID=A0A543GHA8_9PSEU|nr:ABC transporter permease [Pseudonocardia cypriaca]TQM45461.1 NitT/TauT family transport system permease protein [Pseudonocardia cypriaca]
MNEPTSAGKAVLEATRRAHRATRTAERRFLLAARAGIVVVALAGWELASGTLVRSFYVSSPGDVAETLVEWVMSGELVYHGGFTVTAAFLGYVLGAVAAVLVAWPLAMLRTAYRITEPYFLVAYSVPAVAMGPVFILWFGIGLTPKVLIAAYFVFFIVFINTVTGFQQVPTGLLDVTRVMGASRRDLLRTVLLPSALPFVLAALRITLPAAMIGAVTGEFISSNRGLGYLTRAAAASYSTAGVLAGVLCLSAIVLLMNLLLRPLRHALRWQPDIDPPQAADGR